KLRHQAWFDPQSEPFDDMRQAYAPLVWQCRFSGVETPDALWRHGYSGVGKPYGQDQAEHMLLEEDFLAGFDAFVRDFAAFVAAKGQVEPGPYRAYGYEAPGHRLADLRLKWRELRMRAGLPPAGSSPAAQQRAGLNRDDGWRAASLSEGEKRRRADD
ncbi:MAG TPA: hypothetical protein VIL72_04545, partial [Beijerinckiaceae bacterium]